MSTWAADPSVLLAGLGNQARLEARTWWSTRRWWTQAVLWTVILNGLLALMLWVIPRMDSVLAGVPVEPEGVAFQFGSMATAVTAIGVVIICQGVVIDDRRLGLLEWMLSKPLSRPALLLAKFGGHASGLLVSLLLLPWLVVYGQLSLAGGGVWPVGRWLGAVGLVGVVVSFHLVLVLLLSTLFDGRGAVMALPLAGVLGTDVLIDLVPRLADVLPWTLTRHVGAVLADGVLPSARPLLATSAWTVVFLVAALWRFQHTELG